MAVKDLSRLNPKLEALLAEADLFLRKPRKRAEIQKHFGIDNLHCLILIDTLSRRYYVWEDGDKQDTVYQSDGPLNMPKPKKWVSAAEDNGLYPPDPTETYHINLGDED